MKLEILKNNYVLLKTQFEFYYKGQTHIIEKGFYFNGGNIPRLFWAISHPFLYPYLVAYLIHDFMYSKKFKGEATRKECDRFFMDNIFLHNKKISLIFYLGVRLGGRKAFRKDLPFDKKEYLKLRFNKYDLLYSTIHSNGLKQTVAKRETNRTI